MWSCRTSSSSVALLFLTFVDGSRYAMDADGKSTSTPALHRHFQPAAIGH
jgi:hypothetical protein